MLDVGQALRLHARAARRLLVQTLDVVDPVVDVLGRRDGLDGRRALVVQRHFLRERAKPQTQQTRVRLVLRTRLVDDQESQAIIYAIGTRDLDEGINVANSWNVLRDERLQLE